MERIAFGVERFAIFDTDIHPASHPTVTAGASDPFVRCFGFGNFAEDGVVDEGIFVLFDVEAEKLFCFFNKTHLVFLKFFLLFRCFFLLFL